VPCPLWLFKATLWTAHISLLSCRAAINYQLATSDKGRFVRCEIQHSVGDILSGSNTTQRYTPAIRFLQASGGLFQHIRVNRARMDRVAPDVVSGMLHCRSFGEKPYGTFGCRIRRRAIWIPHESSD